MRARRGFTKSRGRNLPGLEPAPDYRPRGRVSAGKPPQRETVADPMEASIVEASTACAAITSATQAVSRFA